MLGLTVVVAAALGALMFVASPGIAARGSLTSFRAVYWTEDYAIRRVMTVRVHYAGEASGAAARVREYQQRYDSVNQQSAACGCGYDEVASAGERLAQWKGFYYEASRGWRIPRADCRGRGAPDRTFRFKSFRCVVLIDHNDTPQVRSLYLRPVTRTGFAIRWIS